MKILFQKKFKKPYPKVKKYPWSGKGIRPKAIQTMSSGFAELNGEEMEFVDIRVFLPKK